MAPLTSGSSTASRRQPELPAFSRTRRRQVSINPCSLNGLRILLVALLLVQLSTLLLVLAGPVPPKPPWPESRDSAVARTERP